MKFTGFLWGGAAVVAAIGGWAFYLEGAAEIAEMVDGSERAVAERVDERVDMTIGRVDRIVARADRRIDAIDRAIDHAIDRPNPNFTAEMERLEADIEAGVISRSDAIDRAVQASIDGGRGPGSERAVPEDEVSAAQAIFGEARGELQAAKDEMRKLREDGRISQEAYSDTLAALARAEARIEEAEVARQY